MTSIRPWLLALAVGLAFTASQCFAQGGGGGGGSTTGRSTGGGGGGATSTTGGGGGMSSTGGGSSSGASRAGGGGSGGVAQPSFTQFGQAGAQVGNGFVGGGNTNQTFVGQSNAGRQTIDAGGTARFSGLGGGSGGGGSGSVSISQARGGQMRIPRQLAFDLPQFPVATLQLTMQSKFTAFESRFSDVTVVTDVPGRVILQGTVETEHAKRLAEAVARLEPGVREIQNELEVGDGMDTIRPPQLTP